MAAAHALSSPTAVHVRGGIQESHLFSPALRASLNCPGPNYREHQEVFDEIHNTLERIQNRRRTNGPRVAAVLQKTSRHYDSLSPEMQLDACDEVGPEFELPLDDDEADDQEEENSAEDRWSHVRKKVKKKSIKFVSVVNQGQLRLQSKINAGLASQEHRRASISGALATVKESIKHTAATRGKSEPSWKAKSARVRPGKASTRQKFQKSAGALIAGVRSRRGSQDSGEGKEPLASTLSSPASVAASEQQAMPLKSLVEARPLDKVPLRVRLLDDIMFGPTSPRVLSAGDKLTVLKLEQDHLVRFKDPDTPPEAPVITRPSKTATSTVFEESAAHLGELCHFELLATQPEHDGQRFDTVADVMRSTPSPPDRVRALGGYSADALGAEDGVEAGDHLIVGTATCMKNDVEYAVWFKPVRDTDGHASQDSGGDVIVARREPILLPVTADCGFSADFPDSSYSLARLADEMQAGLLSTPCRVAVLKKPSRACKVTNGSASSGQRRQLQVLKVTPTHNLLMTNDVELLRMPRGLSAKVHCVQIGLDTKTMLKALQVMVEGSDYARIRTLRPAQPHSLSAQLQPPVEKPSTLSVKRAVADDGAPSPPKTPRGVRLVGGVAADKLAASLRHVMSQSDGTHSESGLGSDGSAGCPQRKVTPTTPVGYASIDDMQTHVQPRARNPSAGISSDSATSTKFTRNLGRQDATCNGHDILCQQLSHSPQHPNHRSGDSPLASSSPSSITSFCSPQGSPRRHRSKHQSHRSTQNRDGDLTAMSASLGMLMIGSQRSQYSRTSSPGSPEKVIKTAVTYDTPRSIAKQKGNMMTAGQGGGRRKSDPAVRVLATPPSMRPARPPFPPSFALGGPPRDANHKVSTLASSRDGSASKQPASSIRTNSLGRPKRKMSRLHSANTNRFSTLSRSRSHSPSPPVPTSMSVGITPEMAAHWKHRCEILRLELQDTKRELSAAHEEIDSLKDQLQWAEAAAQATMSQHGVPPSRVQSYFEAELSEKLAKHRSTMQSTDDCQETPNVKVRPPRLPASIADKPSPSDSPSDKTSPPASHVNKISPSASHVNKTSLSSSPVDKLSPPAGHVARISPSASHVDKTSVSASQAENPARPDMAKLLGNAILGPGSSDDNSQTRPILRNVERRSKNTYI
eukprot:scpid6812/ scgid28076/ 